MSHSGAEPQVRSGAGRCACWRPALLVWLVLSCSAPGITGGVLAARWIVEGREPVVVTLSFRPERRGEGLMSVTLGPEGQRFTGEYLRVLEGVPEERLRRIYAGWNAPRFDHFERGPYGAPWVRDELSFAAFRSRAKGDLVALLAGNRGDAMRCRLTLARPENGLAGGASGRCQVADGSRLEVDNPRPFVERGSGAGANQP